MKMRRQITDMAIVTIPDENQTLCGTSEIAHSLARLGVIYQRWELSELIAPDAAAENILGAYADEINQLKAQGGYSGADVVGVDQNTPGLADILAMFNREHWHEEDEARLILQGQGRYYIRPQQGPVVAIELTAGDLLCVPRGTWHWFKLGSEPKIQAIRFYQDPERWQPRYTESGIEHRY